MANLGEKLKAANEAREAEVSAAEVRKRERDRKAFEIANTQILNKLEEIKNKIVNDIEDGITPKGYKLPKWDAFDTYGWPSKTMVGKFEKTNHPHYTALQSFFDWADENGLVGKFNYEWDGGGIESWFTATVEPK